ncbi:MAG: UbiA family prenyltransferase [bacterium]
MNKSIRLYIKSMRPYLFFITGISGWLGILFANTSSSIPRQIIVLSILFLSWGINQVINDLLGIEEDKINAPHRPIASGELSKKHVLLFSICLFALGAIATYFLNPYALIIYFCGYLFNIIYEYCKGLPLLGNIWFGILIAVTPFYGALAVSKGDIISVLCNKDLIFIALFIALISSTMTFFTYFKDYSGDKQTGKKTLVVLLTPKKAKLLNFVASTIPFLVLFIVLFFNLWQPNTNLVFWILIAIAFIILQYTAFLYFKNPYGKATYYSLKWNFEGATMFQIAFMALINPLLSVIVFVIGFITVGYLFNLYKDPLM